MFAAAICGVSFGASAAYAENEGESGASIIRVCVNYKLAEYGAIVLDENDIEEDRWAETYSAVNEARQGFRDNLDNDSKYGSNSNRVMSHVVAEDINALVCDENSAYQGYSFTASYILPEESRDDSTFNEAPGTTDDLLEFKQNSPVATYSEEPEITLSEEQARAIQEKLEGISKNANLGFFFLDLDTGNCISYNIDQPIYGASSFKGPYCTYICDHLIDEGAYHFPKSSSNIDGNESYLFETLGLNEEELFAGSLIQAVDSVVASAAEEVSGRQQEKENSVGDFKNSTGLQNSITAVVRESDNNLYRSLRYSYDRCGFAEYLDGIGIDSTVITSQWSFPTYSTRTSALLWLNTYHYLFNRDQSETAGWLADLYASTNLSFIRSGVEQAGVPAYVMNKAGWIAGGGFNSTTDAALIEIGNKTYLMSIMTDQPDGDASERKVADLACALIQARGALDSRS